MIIKYWVKIFNSQNLIIRFTYDTLSLIKGRNWVKKVKALLERLGLANFWLAQRVDNENHFFRLVKQRLIDNFLQNWRARVYQSTRIELFCGILEPDFCTPIYLYMIPENLRIHMSRIRCGSHRLEIETGRYRNLDRNQRLRQICNGDAVEDELHFILVCPLYNEARNRLIPLYFCDHPTKYNLYQLFKSRSRERLLALSKFIKIALKIRKNYIASLDAGHPAAPPP